MISARSLCSIRLQHGFRSTSTDEPGCIERASRSQRLSRVQVLGPSLLSRCKTLPNASHVLQTPEPRGAGIQREHKVFHSACSKGSTKLHSSFSQCSSPFPGQATHVGSTSWTNACGGMQFHSLSCTTYYWVTMGSAARNCFCI